MDLYKNGIPLPFIMQLLGHESMSTTSGFYAFATLEMMSDAINKSAPTIGGTEKLWKNKNAKQALYTLDWKYYTEKSYVESAYLQDSEIFRYRNLLGIISVIPNSGQRRFRLCLERWQEWRSTARPVGSLAVYGSVRGRQSWKLRCAERTSVGTMARRKGA